MLFFGYAFLVVCWSLFVACCSLLMCVVVCWLFLCSGLVCCLLVMCVFDVRVCLLFVVCSCVCNVCGCVLLFVNCLLFVVVWYRLL